MNAVASVRPRPAGVLDDAGFTIATIALSRAILVAAAVSTAIVRAGVDRPNVRAADLGPILERVLSRLALSGDGATYLQIARTGYEAGPFVATGRHDWAFWPLLPAIDALFGGSVAVGVLVATVAFVLAALLLAAEVRHESGPDAARWTILFLAFWPTSYVLTSFRPESLQLLGWVAAWALARHRRWLPAWIAVGIATLARPTGVLGAILVIAEVARARPSRRAAGLALLPALVPALAIVGFSAFLAVRTGQPLAWLYAQAGWRPAAGAFGLPGAYADAPLVRGWYDLVLLNLPALVVGLLAAVRLVARRHGGEAAFTAAVSVAGPVAGSLIAETRFLAPVFPVHVLAGEDPILDRVRLGLLIASAAVFTLVGAWIGLGSLAATA